jgi:hypothetical protein
MPRRFLPLLAVAFVPTLAPAADKIPDDQLKFFESKIRPVLVDKCYSCHSAETKKPKGGLTLDTREGLRKGGDSGTAVVPGNAKKSILIKALKGIDDQSQMPPKEKLTADVIADFEKWVNMGAPDPRDGKTTTPIKPIDVAKGKTHWAFQPVREPAVPKVSNDKWQVASPVDAFIAAKHAEKGLTPVPDADKRTLLRRIYFDLIGLPPTVEEMTAFLNDSSPTAFENVVDKLLASPQFGEKWGRHWLDVARYAESTGKERNVYYPHAWRYRDYVIAAFNQDKPIDQFFQEQLAGDLMGGKDDNQKAQRLIATGYLAIGPKSLNEMKPAQFVLDVADEQIDAFSQGMLGLTVACARCHDHKFDPIPTKDYYALAGIFTSTETKVGTPRLVLARNGTGPITLPAKADVPLGQTLTKSEQDRMKERLEDLKKRRDAALEEARKDRQTPVQLVGLNNQIGSLEGALEQYDSDGQAKKLAMGVSDKFFPKDIPIHIRGELDKTGEVVPRGFVTVITSSTAPKVNRKQSGRKELAEWVTSKNNPLTARVYVNRIWQHLFGHGIVATPDNFGTTGRPPTHPELLDYLAATFTKNGWSTKKLIRTLVLSHTYRMSSDHHAGNYGIDPDNEYLWRMSKRRLDAEALRDSMLAASGELDLKPANGSPISKNSGLVQALGPFSMSAATDDSRHRTVYIPIVRDSVPESLELFDFAEPSLVSGSRDDTSVPSQALYMLNNARVMKLAEATAERLFKKASSESERIDTAFRTVLSRPASSQEAASAAKFLQHFRQTESRGFRRRPVGDLAAWSALVQALFASAEFRYLD